MRIVSFGSLSGQCVFIVRTYILGGGYMSAEAFKDLTPEIKHCKIGGTASDQWVAVFVMDSKKPKAELYNA